MTTKPSDESVPKRGAGETARALHRAAWNLLMYVDGPMQFDKLDRTLMARVRTSCNNFGVVGDIEPLVTAARALLVNIDTHYPHSETAHLHEAMLLTLEAALEPFEPATSDEIKMGQRLQAEINDIEHDEQRCRQASDDPNYVYDPHYVKIAKQVLGMRPRPKGPTEDVYARAARAILGTATTPDLYTRVTLPDATVTWLKGRMAMLKLDLLIEKKRMLKDRGSDTTKYALVLAGIEQDLVEINRISDALS